MESASNEISIKVTIEDRHYPLKIDAVEEEFVRSAAKRVNERSKFYQENFSVKDKQDSLALAALDFAVEMASMRHHTEIQNNLFNDKFNRFQKLLDDAILTAGEQ
ncbi:MAG: cell division protein ZapA [Bacteroidetes bacterium]|nr:cell division protein ZapA [Bacteroidota bacterium]